MVRKEDKNSGSAADAQLKALQDSIQKAQSATQKQMLKNQRDITRKREEAHDWLCSLADNAITASESEIWLKDLYENLDFAKNAGVDDLHMAIKNYREQHGNIMEAITVFSGTKQ